VVLWAGLVLVTLGAFAPALENGLVDWDDRANLLLNDRYQGLSPAHLAWMFTTAHGGHYHPLTWLSFAVDYTLYGGISAFGVHLTNLVLHVLTVLGVAVVIRQLLRAALAEVGGRVLTLAAVLAAAVYAVHPLRVESVAWATERRDVLCGALLVWAIVAYVRAVRPDGPDRGSVDAGIRLDGGTAAQAEACGSGEAAQAEACGSGEAAQAEACGSGESARSTSGSPSSVDGGAAAQAEACGSGERRRRLLLHVVAWLLFVASLLAKAVGMTAPLVLLVLDVYPLRRIGPWSRGAKRAATARVAVEKLVWLVPAALAAGAALWAQREVGALRTFAQLGLDVRVAQAFHGIAFYLEQTLLPWPLLPLYEQDPHPVALSVANIGAAALVLAITVALALLARRRLAPLVAWIVFLILLSPTLGLAQSGPQLVADRYTYLPSVALAALLAGGLAVGIHSGPVAQRRRRTTRVVLAGGVVLAVLVTMTRAQTRVWSDSLRLWEHVVHHAPETPLAWSNYAVALNERGRYAEGRDAARRSLELVPVNPVTHIALARALSELGDLEGAVRHYRTALGLKPDDPSCMLSLAIVHTRQGQPDAAESLYRRLVEVEPRNADWRNILGGFLASQGQTAEARACFEEALRLDPEHVEACARLGTLLEQDGDLRAAIETWEAGLRRAPRDNTLCTRLAWALATAEDDRVGNPTRALVLANVAVEGSGGANIRAREARAVAMARLGDAERAVDELGRLLADPPETLDAALRARVAAMLADIRAGRIPRRTTSAPADDAADTPPAEGSTPAPP
jgi:tetratricopeptide (TPR) repeat protein